jgi:D-alanine-D-alanine ligase
MARRAYDALDCEGLARVDFFVGPTARLTGQRGQHDARLHADVDVPRMWAASGVDYPELVDRLVQAALRRGTGLR